MTTLGLLMEAPRIGLMPREAAQQFVRAGLLHTIDIPEAGSFGSIGYSVRSNKDSSPACALFVESLREVSEAASRDGGTFDHSR